VTTDSKDIRPIKTAFIPKNSLEIEQAYSYSSKASLQRDNHATTQFFTGRMPFLSPNQQRQSTEGNLFIIKSYTTDRHTVRTMKAVKAAQNSNTRQKHRL